MPYSFNPFTGNFDIVNSTTIENSVFSTVSGLSSNWESTYTTVSSLSTYWGQELVDEVDDEITEIIPSNQFLRLYLGDGIFKYLRLYDLTLPYLWSDENDNQLVDENDNDLVL
jgi:hypothetical protein